MNTEQIITNRHADLLSTRELITSDGYKTHTVIKFNLYIERHFPNENKFVSLSAYADIYQKMINQYNQGKKNNDQSYFNVCGALETVSIETLKFYQQEVGISGPQNIDIDHPMYIIQFKRDLILCNGYHRVLAKMVSGEASIQGFVLPVDKDR